ncbi:MAG: FG-GAP repeat protein [Marinicellaceae bacterium]
MVLGRPLLNSPGIAYVYDFDGVQWQLSQVLSGLGAPGDYFGSSVSLSGNRLLVGAFNDNNPNGRSGAAYIFDYNGNEWTMTQKIRDDIGDISSRFGIAVSLEGDRVLIGAAGSIGAAFIYELDGNTWLQKQEFFLNNSFSSSRFGSSVNLSSSRAIIGAPSGKGFAHVYDFNGSTWNKIQTILPSDSTEADLFGHNVSVFGDSLLIGAPDNDDTGAVYQFTLDNNVWVQQQQILPDESAEFDAFSSSISLFGNRALVGAHLDDENGTDSGSAYIFDFDGSHWILTQKLFANDGQEGDYFGQNVSLFEGRALIGSQSDSINGNRTGSAYLFNLIEGEWLQIQKINDTDGQFEDEFGGKVSLSNDHALIGAINDNDRGTNSGSVYAYELKNDVLFFSNFEVIIANQ